MASRLQTVSVGIVLASLIGLPATARAQALGVQGGATYSNFKFEEPVVETDSVWGGTGGVFFLLGGRGMFGGLVEANWIQRGTTLLPSGTEIKADYIEIPVAARLLFGEGELRLFALAGGTFAWRTAVSQSGPQVFDDIADDIAKYDHGILAGGGVEYGRLVGSVRYTWGTRDVSDRTVEAYNRGWTFHAGFKLLGR